MREGHNGLGLGAALDKEVERINAGFPAGRGLSEPTRVRDRTEVPVSA